MEKKNSAVFKWTSEYLQIKMALTKSILVSPNQLKFPIALLANTQIVPFKGNILDSRF